MTVLKIKQIDLFTKFIFGFNLINVISYLTYGYMPLKYFYAWIFGRTH